MRQGTNVAPPGLAGLQVVETCLSQVDGQAGRLLIAGQPLQQWTSDADTEVLAWRLWRRVGVALPDADGFRQACRQARHVDPALVRMVQAAGAQNVDATRALRLACTAMDQYGSDSGDASSASNESGLRTFAAMPVLLAAWICGRRGQELPASRDELSAADNFFHLLGEPFDPWRSKALETYWATVCEHGLNCSTFAVRVVASSRADLRSACAAGFGALLGVLHGGAPEPVLRMLKNLVHHPDPSLWVAEQLAAGERIMGFGHRVYKQRDPRAAVLFALLAQRSEQQRGLCLRHAATLEQLIAEALAKHKPGRQLHANVEFATAVLLDELGFAPEVFTALFACGRMMGWIAHYHEQRADDVLFRPQAAYSDSRCA